MASKEPRPRLVPSSSYRVRLSCGNLYVTITNKDQKIFEVFAEMGKAGGCLFSLLEALTTSISMGIRHGVPVDVYVSKLKGIRCPTPTWDEGTLYSSCSDSIGQLLEEEKRRIEGEYQNTKQGP